MHEDEVDVHADVVRALLAEQFPRWASLPIARVAHAGTDHHIFRIGDELQARLPKHAPSTGQYELEAALLPRLAPHLPVEVPVPVAQGEPGAGYPFTWGLYRWLPGAPPREATVQLAGDLAAFVGALQRIDTAGGTPGAWRGGPLARRDRATRAGLDWLGDPHATAVWEAALAAPPWGREPVWLHGDVLEGNLLVRGGRLCAVIDWGCAVVGDPAFDYIAAWSLLAPVRSEFREAAGVDDATWTRARGLALSQAVVALPYYLHSAPAIVERSRTVVKEVAADADL